MPNEDQPNTNPGIEQGDELGVFVIGPKAAKASLDRAQREANENAQGVIGEINKETEKPGNPDYIGGDGDAPGSMPDPEPSK